MNSKPYYEVRKIKNLKDLFYSSCEIFKNNVAYLRKNENRIYEEIKYFEVKEKVESFATGLMELGLNDKRIAIIGENRFEWAVSYFSVVTGVGVVVPLDKQLPQKEIENCLRRAEVSAIIYSDKLKDTIKNIAENILNIKYFIGMDLKEDEQSEKFLSFESVVKKGKKLLEEGKKEYIDKTVDSKKMISLVFTSGTTSESKAVMLSDENICFNIYQQCKMLNIEPKDRFLSLLPLHHTYECTCGFLTPFYRGASVAYCEGLKHIQKNMQEAKVSVVLAVPIVFETIYRKIWETINKQEKTNLVKKMIAFTNALQKIGINLKKKVFKQIHSQLGGNIKVLIAGAAGINPEVSKGFRDFGLLTLQGYGLTECAPIVCLNRDVDYRDDACGLPLVETKVEIDNPNEEGIGEIKVYGKHIMMGYYENEKATNEVIKDGWFYTGDLGYKDKDNFVHITGRKKNVILTKNGKNVYPEELEILINNLDIVKEAMVYEKKSKDDVIIATQVILDKEAIETKYKDNIPSDDELKNILWEEIKKINSTLVIYKHIRTVEIREKDFEKTTTMKIKRYIEKENIKE